MNGADLFEKIVLPAAGAAALLLGSWAFGRFNNALACGMRARRLPLPGRPRQDHLILGFDLKKAPPSRIRLAGCVVEVDLSTSESMERQRDEPASEGLSRSLQSDFIGRGEGIALVADDVVTYEAYCRVPSDAIAHIKLRLVAHQMILEWLRIATPSWTSSIVVTPLPPRTNTTVPDAPLAAAADRPAASSRERPLDGVEEAFGSKVL